MFPHRIALAAPVAVVLALLFASPASAAATGSTSGVRWRSWNEGLREAAASNRPVLVDVYTDWCGWCRRMDRDVYARKDVEAYLSKRFVPIKLNAESRTSASYQGKAQTLRSIALRFGVSGYPTSVFLRPDGQHLGNMDGYIPADRFLLILRYIGDGHLDRGTTFEDFAEQNGAGSGQR